MTSWDDYWKSFDLLIVKLNRAKQVKVANELKDGQKNVNGLTDGWFEFKTAMEKILQLNRSKMTAEQVSILRELIETLRDSLASRD